MAPKRKSGEGEKGVSRVWEKEPAPEEEEEEEKEEEEEEEEEDREGEWGQKGGAGVGGSHSQENGVHSGQQKQQQEGQAPAGGKKAKAERREPVTIAISIAYQEAGAESESQVTYRVKATTKMEKVFKVWCDKLSCDIEDMRFYCDSKRVPKKETVQGAKLKDGAILQAFNRKTGGASTGITVCCTT